MSGWVNHIEPARGTRRIHIWTVKGPKSRFLLDLSNFPSWRRPKFTNDFLHLEWIGESTLRATRKEWRSSRRAEAAA